MRLALAEHRALRIAATADLHYGKHSRGTLHEAFAEISSSADILLLCGDLTDYGLPDEAEALVADIRAAVKIPMLAVLGNHDFESAQAELVCKVLDDAGVNVLDGEAIEVAGAGFAGVPGFGGGFGRRMLNAWANRSSNNLFRNQSDTLCGWNRRWQNYKQNGESSSCTTLPSAPP
jgi:Icc-related predicted phosphoesterase